MASFREMVSRRDNRQNIVEEDYEEEELELPPEPRQRDIVDVLKDKIDFVKEQFGRRGLEELDEVIIDWFDSYRGGSQVREVQEVRRAAPVKKADVVPEIRDNRPAEPEDVHEDMLDNTDDESVLGNDDLVTELI